YGDGITFFPVGEVVKAAAGLDDFDPPEEIERKICAVLKDADEPVVCATLAQLFGVSERDTAPEESFWAVRRFLEAVAEGAPLVVEEMLGMLIDDGRLVREGDRWLAVGDLSEVAVPPTIQALLAARLDRLNADERAVIQRAAVEGKQFHVGAVRALLDDDR